MPKHVLDVIAWRPCERNTLKGFASVQVRELRLTIHDVALHEKNGKHWAQPPSKPMVQDGLPIHNHSGPPSQRGAEQYPAEPSVEALLPVEQLPHGLWEQCGKSDSPLVRTLEARGHRVIAHDLIRDGIDLLISEMRERGCSQQSVMFAVDGLSHKGWRADPRNHP